MTDEAAVRRWVEDYRRAWESNDRQEIGALFADDAVYRDAPFDEPRHGRDAIVDGWLQNRDEPGETTFEWSVAGVSGDTAFVEGTTTYPGRTYSNLWVIQLDDEGRARSFTEWYMKHPESSSV